MGARQRRSWLMLSAIAAIGCASPFQPALAADIEASPIWNTDDAKVECLPVCTTVEGHWNGQWHTTVWAKMSVCSCEEDTSPADQISMSNILRHA